MNTGPNVPEPSYNGGNKSERATATNGGTLLTIDTLLVKGAAAVAESKSIASQDPSDLDGGAAFPVFAPSDGSVAATYHPGMSLRDWFAGQALAGSLGGVPGSHLIPENAAREAYAHADAMLKARAESK